MTEPECAVIPCVYVALERSPAPNIQLTLPSKIKYEVCRRHGEVRREETNTASKGE